MQLIFYHLKEYCSSDSHPVKLDLKGSVEEEVAMVITAAPFHPVTAIVHIHIQSDHFLLWNSGSYERRKTYCEDWHADQSNGVHSFH